MKPFHRVCICLGLTLCLLGFTGCKKEPAEEPVKPDGPKPVSFQNTNKVVAAKVAEPDVTDTTVVTATADFNNDGLKDLAVLHKAKGRKNEVDIYIRKKPDAPTEGTPSATAKREYFHAGTIQQGGEGRVMGLMVESRQQFADLILLMEYSDRVNREMVHYRNDGKRFIVVSREQASARKPDVQGQ
jgi:hypothetical protein